MIVVSDTTPIVSLLKMNKLELLNKLFGEILIPKAVFEELIINEKYKDEANEIKQCKFIFVKDTKILKKLMRCKIKQDWI